MTYWPIACSDLHHLQRNFLSFFPSFYCLPRAQAQCENEQFGFIDASSVSRPVFFGVARRTFSDICVFFTRREYSLVPGRAKKTLKKFC